MAVESLEQRKMLTALNVFVNGVLGGTTIHVTEETSFAHYPSFSKPQGTFIGASITVTDPNAGFAYTPGNTSITGGTNPSGFYGPAFRINQGNGVDKVWINDPTMIDLQKNGSFSLVFTATDGTNTGTATLNIIVDSANPNIIPVIPQFPYQNNGTIDAMGNNSNSNFTGGIQNTGDATDANSQTNTNTSLLPGLDSPTGSGVNLLRVKENSPLGTVIGPVVADTPEEPYNHSVLTYSLVGTIPVFNSSDPAIAIDAFSGKITITDPSFFNYEALRTANAAQGNLGENPKIYDANGITNYTVPGVVLDALVRVQDQVGNSNFTTQPDGSVTNYSHVYIRVLDVGEIPPDVSHATTSLNVNETTSTAVPNASVVGTSVGFFDINAGVPNFYIPAGGSVRIANTATNLGLSTPEGQQRYSFFIVGGNTGNAFTIDPTTGEITVANANIDFETLNNYTLQIKVVSDNGPLNPNAGTVPSADALGAVPNVAPLSTVASLHITVNDVNEQTVIPDNQNFTIPEGSVDGTIVGAVVATDPDTQQPNGLGKLVYSIVSGNSVTINGTVYSGIFQIDSNTGVISVANSTGQSNAAVLDYINQPTFALTIQAVDRGDLITAANKAVVVNLSKVDSTPPVFADKSFTINENQPNGTLVGTVTATAGQSDFSVVGYTITAGNTGNAFAISNSGQITVNTSSAVNYEVNPIFNLTVMATDDGTPSPLSSTATVTINLNNVNEQISMLPQTFSVAENSAAGTLVNTIFTSDPDNLVANVQGQSFVITGGNTGNAFSIDAQGHITIANPAAVDFEVNPIFSLAVTVTDTGIPSTSMSNIITINVLNQNDAPIVGTQNFNVQEHAVQGTTVGTVVATDQDLPAQKLTYAITGGNLGTVSDPAFNIDPNTGKITVNDPGLIDYATTPTIPLTVTVTDDGSNGTPIPFAPKSTSATVNVLLQDVQEPQLADQTPPSIPEYVPSGATQIGTVVTTDAATHGTAPYTYSILSGNDNLVNGQTGAFAIDSTGKITVANPLALDYETQPTFTLKILAVDSHLNPQLGDTATITINLTNVNEAPTLSAIESSPLSYTENATTPVTSAIVVSDVDSLNAQGAVIQITGNYLKTEDSLGFTAMGNITGVWNSTAGTMTLSGTDTLANYQAALRSITYNDSSDNPNVSVRTVSYTITDDGGLPSNTVTRDINITPVNDPPVLSGIEGTTLAATENVATAITGTLTVTDPDSLNAQSATIQISTNYVSTEDSLAFVAMFNITGSWDSSSGTLTLTGLDTLAHYQTALQAVTYLNSSDAPSGLTRTISFTINDDGASGGLPSNTVTRNLTVTPVNDAPVLSSIEVPPLAVNENIPAAITSTLLITDPDSANAQSATIQITGNYQASEDSLSFTALGNITGVWNSGTGTLTLSGLDTLANYQAALRSVMYNDSADAPNVSIRTVSFTIHDDGTAGGLPSNTVTRNINVNPVNDSPVLSGIEGSPLPYVENGVTPITNAIIATDPDSTNASGAVIKITGGYLSSQDSLVFTNTLKITGTWNSSTATMTLSGSDTFANYQAALRAVRYSNSSNAPNVTQRTVSFTITDSSGSPSNTLTRGITITPQNDPPKLISIESTAATYTENANSFATIPVTSTIVATDPDSPNLQGATVKITGHYVYGQDQLNFTTLGAITGSWNAATGTMTLSGTDTLTNYRLAIRSITYQNLSHNPDTTARTLTFQVTDSSGAPSATVTRNINLVAVNNAPVLASVVSNVGYTEGTGPQVINGSITVSDVDSTKLSTGTITITTNYDSTQDVLGFVSNGATMGNISISSNAGGVLTLTSVGATATLAQWQAAFRAVTYNNTGNSLTPPARTVTFVADDGSAVNNLSNTLSTGINITPIYPPVLAGTNNKTYIEQTPAIAIDSGITVTDPGTPTLASATIRITNFVSGQDVLGFVPNAATMGNIAILSNSGGVLTLTSAGSSATLAQWQTALRAVTYQNTSLNPTTTTRTVTFQVSNGKAVNALSNILSTKVGISPVNDAPVLSGIESSALSYVELSTNVAITSSLTISDVDSANMSGAVIQITGNFQSGQDQLQFKSTSNITGVYNAFTGKLTLTGADTVANYQAALRSITFFDSSNNPSTAQRTVTFSVTDDGGLPSNSVTRKISITPVDNAPTLTGIETTPLQYIENTPPNYSANNTTVISTAILASDPDSLNMSGATVKITGNYQMNQDFLKFTPVGAITGSFDIATGTLTLTGADTLAHYNTVLDSISYFNLQDNPVTFTRTVAYTITDDLGLSSNTATRLVTVTAVNDPPLLTMVDSGPLTYTEDAAPKPIVPSILAADPDNDNLKGATIQITGNYVNGKDTLAFTNTANITGSWNPATGTLTLTGVDSVSNYRTALRSVTFFNQYDAAVAPTRTVSFTVTDQQGLSGNTVSRNVSITTVSDAAILSGIETTPHVYKANDPYTPPTPITSSLTITDYDSTSVLGATIQITSGYSSGHDRLGFSAPGTAITGSFNTSTGVLTLSGADTIAHYQAALQSVIYYTVNGPASTATRTVTFQTTDNTHLKSNFVSRFVTTTTTNAPPSISLNSSGPLSYTEGDPGTPIAPSVTVTDTDSPNIQNATIKITGNYQPGQDSLQFSSLFNIITAGFSSTTATLVLTGSDTLAHYQAALQSVKFIASGGNPSSASRTISLVVSDGLLSSNIVTQVITVTPVDNAPVLVTNASGALAYQPANGAVAVTPNMGVTDADNSTLTSATISISAGYVRNSDALSFTAVGNITGSFNVQTGVLTLTGTDTLSNYRTVLQSIKYKFTGNAIASTRTVSFSVSDGTLSSTTVTRNINVTP